MSGGSHNYLAYKDSMQLIADEDGCREALDRMIEDMRKHNLSSDILDKAIDIQNKLNHLDNLKESLSIMMGDLSEVFKAVEWVESGDSNKEDLLKYK